MKKSKFLKALAPIVALGLLVGALVGISASANEDAPVAPEIVSMNVEYGSELYLYYAVDASTSAGIPTLQVLSDAEGTEVLYEVKASSETVTIGSRTCYIFKTEGVAPKYLNKLQYVRAVDGDIKGEIKAASIELYLNIKLYNEGFAAKTEADGKDYTRRNLYFQLLKYGNAAQDLFDVKGDEIGKAGIAISGADGLKGGVLSSPGFIALNAKEVSGKTFSYWQVDEYTVFGKYIGSVKLSDGYQYKFTTTTVVTPVYDAESMEGVMIWDKALIRFDEMPAAGKFAITSGFASDKTKAAELYETSGGTKGGIIVGENTWEIVTLEDGNNVLHVSKMCNGRDASGTKVKKEDGTTYSNGGVITTTYVDSKVAGANVAVYEASILLDDVLMRNGIQICVYGTTSSYTHFMFLPFNGEADGTKIQYQDKNGSTTSGSVNLSEDAVVGKWFDLRIEYRVVPNGDGVMSEMRVYINGNLAVTSNNSVVAADKLPDPSEISKVTLALNNDYKGDIYFDNFALKQIIE